MVSNQTFHTWKRAYPFPSVHRVAKSYFQNIFSVTEFGNGERVCLLECTNTLFMNFSDVASAVRDLYVL